MLDILQIGACLIIVCYACARGRKLKWYEMILLLIGTFIFTESLNNFYI